SGSPKSLFGIAAPDAHLQASWSKASRGVFLTSTELPRDAVDLRHPAVGIGAHGGSVVVVVPPVGVVVDVVEEVVAVAALVVDVVEEVVDVAALMVDVVVLVAS